MKHLDHFLTTYDFDGVFIDKIRFPSMANGLQDVFSCFCPYCIEKAAHSGLDLDEVKSILNKKVWQKAAGNKVDIPPGGGLAKDDDQRPAFNTAVHSFQSRLNK